MAIVMTIHPHVCLISFFKHEKFINEEFSLSIKMSSTQKKHRTDVVVGCTDSKAHWGNVICDLGLY